MSKMVDQDYLLNQQYHDRRELAECGALSITKDTGLFEAW